MDCCNRSAVPFNYSTLTLNHLVKDLEKGDTNTLRRCKKMVDLFRMLRRYFEDYYDQIAETQTLDSELKNYHAGHDFTLRAYLRALAVVKKVNVVIQHEDTTEEEHEHLHALQYSAVSLLETVQPLLRDIDRPSRKPGGYNHYFADIYRIAMESCGHQSSSSSKCRTCSCCGCTEKSKAVLQFLDTSTK